MAKELENPRPVADWETRGYWEGAGRGELVLQRCKACGTVQHRPRALCVTCFKDEIEHFVASGRGTVYTFTVTEQNQAPPFRDAVPYVLAYVELEEIMTLGEGLVSAIVQSVLKNKSRELETLKRDTTKLQNVNPPFPRISYEDAIKVLQKRGNAAKFGDDIGGDEETIISNEFDRPVMVHRYPSAIKAFYMQPDAQRPELALAFDMLAPEGYGEIIGGSQRIHDYDLLVKRLREHNLPEEAFQWYLDLRRYGSVPHSGFGLGLERTVAWICGAEHIREVIPFPRMLYRVYP